MGESLRFDARVVYKMDPVEPDNTHPCPECHSNLELRHCTMLRGNIEIPGWFANCPNDYCGLCICFVPDALVTLPGLPLRKDFVWWLLDHGKAEAWDDAIYQIVSCLHERYNDE